MLQYANNVEASMMEYKAQWQQAPQYLETDTSLHKEVILVRQRKCNAEWEKESTSKNKNMKIQDAMNERLGRQVLRLQLMK